jgi:leader peptidase (prepilin peptidase)/N-methyltransferase
VSTGVTIAAALAGVPVGAFLNVVVERTPHKVPLRGAWAEEDIPALAWAGVPVQPFLLRGGRRGRALPGRWLAVEVATVASFAILTSRYGGSTAYLPMLVLAAALVAISFVDLEHLRIPDRITFPALAVSIPAVVIVSMDLDATGALRGAVVGCIAYFLLLLLPHLVYPRGMGFGDVKLALLMGLYLGWVGWTSNEPTAGPLRLVLYALVLGCLMGVVFGLAHAAVTKRRGEFPFGPALAVACLIIVYFAPELTT